MPTDTVQQVRTDVHRVTDGHVNAWFVTDGDAVTILDTGFPWESGRLLTALDQIGRAPSDLEAILVTHAHADHLGGAPSVQDATSLPVTVHRDEVEAATGTAPRSMSWKLVPKFLPHLWRGQTMKFVGHAALTGFLTPRPVERTTGVDDGEVLDVPGRPQVLATPGHTGGHASYLLPETGAVVTGDALVTVDVLTAERGPQLMPPPLNGDHEQARRSLDALTQVEADLVLPGHGDPHHGPVADAAAEARSTHRGS